MIYLLKFIACSGLLLAVYHLLLKNKAMYRFNRAFLLAGIVFSIAVPFIQFEQHVVQMPQIITQPNPVVYQQPAPTVVESYPGQPITKTAVVIAAPQSTSIDYALIVIGVYAIVTCILLFRFVRNLYKIRRATKVNQRINFHEALLVLIPQRLIPHSFFKYIFLNGEDYRQQKIEDKILQHELAHTRQYHSADVVFTELVQVFCWFNPFLILYRRSIQLNHEFLADEAVLNTYADVSEYQHLLLNSMSEAAGLSVTSQFSYKLTKKRLIMMTKKTSFTASALSRLATLLVVAVAFILFCNAAVSKKTMSAMEPRKSKDSVQVNLRQMYALPYAHTTTGVSKKDMDEYAAVAAKYAGVTKEWHSSYKLSKKDMHTMVDIYRKMSVAQQDMQNIGFVYNAAPRSVSPITDRELDAFKDKQAYRIYLNGYHLANDRLAEYKAEDLKRVSIQKDDNEKYKYLVMLTTNDAYEAGRKKMLAEQGGTSLAIGKNFADEAQILNEQADTAKIVRFPPPRFNYPHTKKGVSQKELDDYAAITAKYPVEPYKISWKLKIPVTTADSTKLEQMYRRMSITQQDHQTICFIKHEPPRDMIAVTDDQLQAYKDMGVYDVWVNYKHLNSGGLDKYKAVDLVIAFATKKLNRAISHTKYSYHVSLFTVDFYEAYRKQALADLNKSFIIVRHHDADEIKYPVFKASNVQAKTDTSKNITQMRFPLPYYHTKEGVSQGQLNEYAAIIEKYENEWGNLPPKQRVINQTDKARLIAIYKQMSLAQQEIQVIGFHYGFPLKAAVIPTQTQIDAFKDDHIYGVWVNDKKIANSELDKYKANDFGNVLISRLTKMATNYPKYHYEVNLMTVDYYKAFRKKYGEEMSKDQSWYKAGPGGFVIKNDKYASQATKQYSIANLPWFPFAKGC